MIDFRKESSCDQGLINCFRIDLPTVVQERSLFSERNNTGPWRVVEIETGTNALLYGAFNKLHGSGSREISSVLTPGQC